MEPENGQNLVGDSKPAGWLENCGIESGIRRKLDEGGHYFCKSMDNIFDTVGLAKQELAKRG